MVRVAPTGGAKPATVGAVYDPGHNSPKNPSLDRHYSGVRQRELGAIDYTPEIERFLRRFRRHLERIFANPPLVEGLRKCHADFADEDSMPTVWISQEIAG